MASSVCFQPSRSYSELPYVENAAGVATLHKRCPSHCRGLFGGKGGMVLQTLHQPGPREEPRGALLALTGRLVLVPYKMFSETSAPR
jgi:hypothetical protein